MQAAGGVADDHIHAPGLCGGERVKDHGAGVRALGMSDDVRPGPLSPDGKLVRGGGAEGVGGGEQHLFPLSGKLGADLSDGGGLSHAVDAHHQNDRGLGLQPQAVVGRHLVRQDLCQAVDDLLLGLQVLQLGLLPQLVDGL